MIYHYGIYLKPVQLIEMLGLPEEVEVDSEGDAGRQILFDVRSDAPFNINGVEAAPMREMPWTGLDAIIARKHQLEVESK